ncbi:MAG: NADH-quinone oxidoreductase subunit I [Nitrospirae bacterium]|nr:NADH-quinone oxidoreductase subunit I [Nitrospirota bacterium]
MSNNRKLNFSITNILKKVLFIDLIQGLAVTFGYTFTKTMTMRYPDEETWIPYQRFRGLHTLNRNKAGRELCVGCELCAKSCPTQCITVVPMEDKTGKGIADRVAARWEINLLRCMFCGLCEDACPTEALKLGRQYELAGKKMQRQFRSKDELLAPQAIPFDFEGGVIVKARLERDEDGAVVKPDLSSQKRWW